MLWVLLRIGNNKEGMKEKNETEPCERQARALQVQGLISILEHAPSLLYALTRASLWVL